LLTQKGTPPFLYASDPQLSVITHAAPNARSIPGGPDRNSAPSVSAGSPELRLHPQFFGNPPLVLG
jgi:hypothetical protein